MKKSIYSLSALAFSFLLFSCAEKKDAKTSETAKYQSKTKLAAQTPLAQSMEEGASVYENFCAQCHLPSGKGVPGSFPPLAGSNWLTDKRTESIRAVKYGQRGEITVNGVTYNGIMTPMGLSDKEVADVMNYIMNSWENTQEKMVTESEVAGVAK
tara:strand:+ start:436 stop:900 length:465 start_codon:yes stop_codon:yes gene_type:complete